MDDLPFISAKYNEIHKIGIVIIFITSTGLTYCYLAQDSK
jgi:hypothetical protein